MKRKHFILALVAMLWSFSFSAFAQTIIKVSTGAELREALANGTVTTFSVRAITIPITLEMSGALTDDGEPFVTQDGMNYKLDLNGFELTGSIINNGTLTIVDGSDERTGLISGTITNNEGATLTIESGAINSADVALVNNGTANITGGTITGSIQDNAGTITGLENLTHNVAKVGGVGYTTLAAALKAVTATNNVVDIYDNITIADAWDNRYTGAKFTVPVTINGNDKTIKFTNEVYDGGNYMSAFRFEADATVKDLTVDMSLAQPGFKTNIRAISAKANLTVANCTFIGNGSDNNTRAIIFGEGSGANIGNVVVSITNSEFENWKRGVGDNENAQDAKSVAITGNTFTNSGVNVSAKESVTFTGNTVDAASVNITSYTAVDTYEVVATDNTYSNTDGQTYYISANPENVNTNDAVIALPVAKIGEKYYSTLKGAFDKAVSGNTVTLLADAAIDSETYTIADGVAVTLDMNGKKLTVTDNKTANYELFYIYGEMTVTGNGTIELTSTNDRDWNAMSAIFHNRGGVLTIENGTFKNLGGTDMAWAVDNSGNYYGDATTNIKGGELTSTYTAIRNRMEQNSHGASGTAILNVSGGKIDGTTSAIWAQAASESTTSPATGEINITGGEVGNINTARSAGAECMTTISGGTVAAFKGEAGELKVVAPGEITGEITILSATGEAVPDLAVDADGLYIDALAKIGEVGYKSLQAAINAAANNDVINVLKDVNEDVTVVQAPDRKFTIEGNNKTFAGTITVNGKSAAYATAGLTIRNVKFDTTDIAKEASINLGGNNNIRYTNGVTVDKCTFTGTGKAKVGVKNYTGGCKNVTITNCTATGMHSLAQLKTSTTVTLANNTVTDCKNAISLGSSTGVTVTGCTIDVDGYGVRADGGAGVTVTDNKIDAYIPVAVRKATVESYLTFEGENTMTATNTDGLWCAISSNDDEYGEVAKDALIAPTAQVNVILNDAGLSIDGIYGYTLAGQGTAEAPYLISNINDLKWFRDDVNAGNNYQGKFIKLTADIDLNNEEWEPIAYNGKTFKGTFDGGDNTIKNLKITKTLTNSKENNGIGLFGRTDSPATIKNFTIENVDITGSLYVGAVVGHGYTGKAVEDVTVKGDISIDAWWYAGVIGGNGYMNLVNNCHVIGNDGSYIKGNDGSYIGGIWGFRGEGDYKITNCTVTNLDIQGVDRVGGISGIGHYGNSVTDCAVNSVNVTATDAEATTVGLIVGACQGQESEPTNFTDNTVQTVTVKIGDVVVENPGLYGTNINGDNAVTNYTAQIGGTMYESLAAAIAAVEEGETITILAGEHAEGTIKLPATFKNVTFKGVKGAVLKDMTIQQADGGSYDLANLTFDGITFDNSNIVLTGWRTGFESLKNLTVTNCTFKNIVRDTNLAAVHINVAADKAVNGFTFTNNVIDGVTGAKNSGIYGQFTGKVTVENNVINNVAFRPYVIQLTTDDGIADNFTVTGNTFSGSAAGRAQGLGNNAEGTDAVTLVISENIFKGITDAQQICYWNFNEETTTATLEKNYYDVNVIEKADRFYFNSAASSASDLVAMGVFPVYTELNEDGTINEESLSIVPVAVTNNTGYATVTEAINAAADGATVEILAGEHTEYIAPWAGNSKHDTEKSLTIVGAADYATVLKGGMYLGYDDSQCREHTIVVKGIAFEGKGLKVACQQNVTIESNKFTNIEADNAIDVIGKNIVSTVKDNTITTANKLGINLRNALDATVVGNTISGTTHNAIQITSQVGSTESKAVVENNTLSNWGTEGEGRAMRIEGIVTATINGNVMSHTAAPEEFVKVTNSTALDASANYWNGNTPMTTGLFTDGVEGSDPLAFIHSYYTDAEKSNLVTFTTSESAAIINGVYYETFKAAIAAVKDGETITLLKACAENVTITQVKTKSFTVNGNNNTYTGTITVTGDKVSNGNNTETLTFKNIKFDLTAATALKYAIQTTKGSYARNITVDGCTFKGNYEGSTGYSYGIRIRNGYNLTVKNTTASNMVCLVYASESLNGLVVEDVNVTNTNVAFSANYGTGNASFKNVTLDVTASGVYVKNQNPSNLTFENCTINAKTPIWFAEAKTNTNSVTLNGTNNITVKETSETGNWLRIDDVADYAATFKVVDNSGTLDMTKTSGLVAYANNGERSFGYNNLSKVINNTADGDVVTLLTDVAMTAANYVTIKDNYAVLFGIKDKAITVDLNGKVITVNASAAELAEAEGEMLMSVFGIDVNGNLTLKDSSTESIGAVNVTANDATVYSIAAAYGDNPMLTIDGGSYTLDKGSGVIYAQYSEVVTVNGGNFHLGNRGTSTNASPWIFNVKGGNDGYVTVNGGTFNEDINHYFWANEVYVPETLALKNNGYDTWTVVPAVAYVNETGTSTGSRERKVGYATLDEALAAADGGRTVTLLQDFELEKTYTLKDMELTINGNGKTITQADACNNAIALFDIAGGKVAINNVTFDGMKTGAVVRTVDTEFSMDNVTAVNCQHTVGEGLFRLRGQNTITNSTFKNNNCTLLITLNYDGADPELPQVIDNCLFEGNTANSTAIVYYVKGSKCDITNSEFIGNTVNCNENGAVVYLGFQENCTVTGNLFKNNVVTDASASTRVAGALFFGSQAVVNGNAFENNTASNANSDVLGQVCTSTYYEGTIDLSGNYWGGEAPVYGKDYTVQHTASGEASFDVSNYYTSYSLDENGNLVLGGQGEFAYVAQAGKFKYATLEAAIAAANASTADEITVTMLADAVVTEGLTIAADKNVTLELNGKTISQTKEQTAGYQMILNDGNLIINDAVGGGKISYTDSGNGGNYISDVIYNRGVLVINGGTIENLSSATVANNGFPHAVDTYSGIRNTSVTINGGTITCAEYSAIRMFCVSATYTADLVINGGTINGAIDMQNGTAAAANGSLTITDGEFNKNNSSANVRFANWNGGATTYGITASISGGTFDDGINTAYVPAGADFNSKFITGGTFGVDVNEYCADGYTVEPNDDGTYSIVTGITIIDGQLTEFTNADTCEVSYIRYERTFTNVNKWQALYVPFEIPVETLTELGYEVAYLYDVHNKVVAGEEIDPTAIESIHFVKITKGTLRANYPYIIRPTATADLKLVLEFNNATLFSTTKDDMISVESSTTTTRYIFAGTYTRTKRATLTGDDNIPCYAIWPDGVWYPMTADNNLGAFRIFMYIVNKDGSPVIVSDEAAKSIKIRVIGEENEDGTTTIYDVEADEQAVDYIYDLQGRRVLEPQKGGLYIVNGKKVIF